jgi:hypothetical protein
MSGLRKGACKIGLIGDLALLLRGQVEIEVAAAGQRAPAIEQPRAIMREGGRQIGIDQQASPRLRSTGARPCHNAA